MVLLFFEIAELHLGKIIIVNNVLIPGLSIF